MTRAKDQVSIVSAYSFVVTADTLKLSLSDEHAKYEWVDYDTAI
jgi:hypothetical protein